MWLKTMRTKLNHRVLTFLTSEKRNISQLDTKGKENCSERKNPSYNGTTHTMNGDGVANTNTQCMSVF